jgi:hypothetical protein
MLHNEHLRKADELYEVRHDNDGNAIHIFIKDGEAIIFPTLWDLISHQCYNGIPEVERFYLDEEELINLYSFEVYDYYSLKEIAKKITDGEIPPPPVEENSII